MRIVSFILAIMFLAFAFLQVNDPDPVHWILIYGAMAVVCILAMFELYFKKAMLVLLLVYAAYSVVFIPGLQEWMQQPDKGAIFDDLAKMEHPYIESSREFIGLMICIVVLVFYFIRARKK